ncbi:MAG: hypothetical protein DWQ42_12340 [Planctomycetota bacterium]|nr:MAG: hypothetical protein DWQ42_12340 [Planctomycetota bacterium]REK42193.1 MAG: hypothetical protein DWQ46_14220 [Planctomycetota bacterium]
MRPGNDDRQRQEELAHHDSPRRVEQLEGPERSATREHRKANQPDQNGGNAHAGAKADHQQAATEERHPSEERSDDNAHERRHRDGERGDPQAPPGSGQHERIERGDQPHRFDQAFPKKLHRGESYSDGPSPQLAESRVGSKSGSPASR